MPPIPGLAEANPWTNREATTSEEVPERLLVLGGGVVGVELGQAWFTLGSKVTIVEAFPRLLGREEEFAATLVHDALVERGVEVRVGSPAVEVSRDDGGVTVRLESGEELTATSCSSASGAARRRATSASRSPGSSPAGRSRSTSSSASRAPTGSSRSATRTAARCSRTWASTTAGSRRT